MTNLAVIPARGGSKGIPRKNAKIIAGKPLVVWSIEACLRAKHVDEVVVSTDDEEIYNIAKDHGATPYMRPAHLGEDNVHSVHVVLDYLSYCEKSGIIVSRVAMILPTAPLKTEEDIDGAFEKLDIGCESVVGVKEYDRPESCLRMVAGKHILPLTDVSCFETQRQDVQRHLVEVNGSIYVSTPEVLKKTRSFILIQLDII